MTRTQRARRYLLTPVDGLSLAFIRIFLGGTLLAEAFGKYAFTHAYFYAQPTTPLGYFGLPPTPPLPEPLFPYFWTGMGLLAFLVSLGAWYRISMVFLTLGMFYLQSWDGALYHFHYNLVCMAMVLLCLLPAHARLSVDAWRKGFGGMVPRGAVLAFQLNMEFFLVYAGLVKLNNDWLHLEPLKMWLLQRPQPWVHTIATHDTLVALGAYGAIILHLVGAPLLMHRKGRPWIFGAYALFHCANGFLFRLNIFPWVSLALTTLFFSPAWPQRFLPRLRTATGIPLKQPQWVWGLLVCWLLFQAAFPLRHWLIEGDAAWTREGDKFSWMMMLNDRYGHLYYTVEAVDGRRFQVNPRPYFNTEQMNAVVCHPDLIRQFALILAKEGRQRGLGKVKVFAHADCSLNGRLETPLINSAVDLATTPWTFGHADWILPKPTSVPGQIYHPKDPVAP